MDTVNDCNDIHWKKFRKNQNVLTPGPASLTPDYYSHNLGSANINGFDYTYNFKLGVYSIVACYITAYCLLANVKIIWWVGHFNKPFLPKNGGE